MIEIDPLSAMTPSTALVFDAMAAVSNNPAVLQALEDSDVTSASIMRAVVDHLQVVPMDATMDMVLVRTSKSPLNNHPRNRRQMPHAFSFFLRTEGWFFAPDTDPCFTPPGQSGWGFVVLQGQAAVFAYEGSRFGGASGPLHHDVVPASITSAGSHSDDLVKAVLDPLLAARTRGDMDRKTALPNTSPPPSPRL